MQRSDLLLGLTSALLTLGIASCGGDGRDDTMDSNGGSGGGSGAGGNAGAASHNGGTGGVAETGAAGAAGGGTGGAAGSATGGAGGAGGTIDPGNTGWRPLYYREQAMFGVEPDFPEYYPYGLYFGEAFQLPHVFVREGDTILYGGDMNGLRISPDAGLTWRHPLSNGLRGCVIHAAAIDPSDPKRVLVAAGVGAFKANYDSVGQEALYISTDGAQNFTKVLDLTQLVQRSNISIDVLSPGPGTDPLLRRWSFMEWSDKAGATTRYWHSADGGVTWQQRPVPYASASVLTLRRQPGAPDTLYAGTTDGLWQTTNNGASWARIGGTRLSGTVPNLWIDPDDPKRMLATKYQGDVFWTSNGGAAAEDWTTVLTGADVGAVHVTVGALNDGRRTIYVTNDTNVVNHKRPYLQHWAVSGAPSSIKRNPPQLSDGDTAPNGQWFRPRAHPIPGSTFISHTDISGRGQTIFRPSPTDPSQCAAMGRIPWRSDGTPSDWVPSSSGFGGMQGRQFAFDPSNPANVLMATNDVEGLYWDGNFPDWGKDWGLEKAQKDELKTLTGSTITSGAGAAILPDHTVPAAARGRMVLSCGPGTTQILYTRDKGAEKTWVRKTSSTAAIPTVFVDPNDPNRIYAGPWRSTNAGDTWTGLGSNRIAAGISGQRSGRLFALADGNKSVVLSLDHGASFQAAPFWTSTKAMAASGRDPWFYLSPFDDTLAVTIDNSGDFVLVEGEMSATTKVSMNLAVQYPASAGPMKPFKVAGGAWCTIHPRRFYAHVTTFGLPLMWMGEFDDQHTSITWTDITGRLPKDSNNRQIAVRPGTGELLVSNGGGIFVLPAPGPLPDGNAYSRLPIMFPYPI